MIVEKFLMFEGVSHMGLVSDSASVFTGDATKDLHVNLFIKVYHSNLQ